MPDPTQDAIVQHLMAGGGTPNMPMTPPTFGERLSAFGTQQPGNIQDMRSLPQGGYEHMLAGNQMIRAVWRSIFGAEPFSDLPVSYARKPTGGNLQNELGVNDIAGKGAL